MEFEFLWWRSENHGFSVALDEKSYGNYDGSGDGKNRGHIVRIPPDWKPGFRLGIGWNSDYDRWDLGADWTYYTNHASVTKVRNDLTVGEPGYDGYYPMWPVANTNFQNLFAPYQVLEAGWHLWQNVFNLDLGRAYSITRHISFKPHWGASGAILKQKFHDLFSVPLNPRGTIETVSQSEFHGKNQWWGIGPRVGVEGSWHLGAGLSILANTSAALYYGQSKVRFHSKQIYAPSGSTSVNRKFNDAFYQLVPNLQLFLGLGWGTCLNCDEVFLGIDAGWETNYWWNQCNLPVAVTGYTAPLPSVGNQPVTMEGLTLNIHIDY
jgi:hypothetical protein